MATDGSLIFDTKVDESGFKKGLNRLQTIGGKALKAIGTAITATSAAIGTIGAAATKVGMDFEKSMSRVAALSGATEKEFKALEKTALELGKSTVFSSSQVAEAMQYLAMAGFKVNEIIAAMPGLLNLAAAGQTDLGVAADITSNILSGFGLAAEEAGRAADVLTKAFTSSNTSLESLGETMKYAAPVAAAAGFSLEEVAAAAGLLGDAGIQGSMAGTVLRGVMLRLVNPPKQAAEALKALGVSVTDSSGKVKPLAQIVKELEEATKDMSEAQRTAIISQIAGQNAASGLLAIMEAGGDTLAAFTKELENAGGTAERIANQQIDNLAGDIEMLKSALEFTGIMIYQGFDKPLRGVTQTITGYIERIGSAIEAHDNLVDGLAATADIIGEMLAEGLGALAKFTPKILDMARNLIVSFIEQIKVNLPAIASSGVEVARSFINAILAILPELLEVGIMFIQELGRGVIDALPSLITAAQDCIETLLTVLIDGLPLLLDMGVQILLMLAKGIAEMMPTLITQAIDLIILIADTLISHIDAIIDAGIQIIIALVQGIVENLPKLIEEVPRIINSFANAIYNNLPTVLKAGVQIILMLIKGLIQSIPTIIKNIPQIIMAIVNVFTLYNWAQLGKNLMKWLGEGIVNMRGNLLNIGKSIAEGVTNAIKNLFKSGTNIGRGLVNNLITGIKGLFGNIVSTASNLASSVIKSITNIFKGAPNIGKSLVQGLWNGINNMTGWILDRIKGFGKSIMNGIKKVFGIASPSKLMRDEIGKNLTLGIGEGFEDEIPKLQRETEKELGRLIEKMKATVELESLTVGAKLSAGSGIVRTTQNIIHNDNGITQNIHFNQPVQSPSETARHIKRIGRELALGY